MAIRVDVAMSIRNDHDIEWLAQDWKRADTVAGLDRMMKPGGVVGIVDVATRHERWHPETHRLNQQVVIDDVTAGGFELVGSSDILANPDDDHSVPGLREGGRLTMDRYVLKLRKPTRQRPGIVDPVGPRCPPRVGTPVGALALRSHRATVHASLYERLTKTYVGEADVEPDAFLQCPGDHQ
jgi:hypothetical protein